MSAIPTLVELEVNRLEDKYHRALVKKEVAHEMGISLSTLDRRMEKAEDIPQYKVTKTGTFLFPLSAVALYLTEDLVRSV